jgi:Ca-activated chloride channel family protein
MTDLRFEHPEFLLIALLAIPLAIAGWLTLTSMDRLRRIVSIALRCLLILAIASALAAPYTVRTHDHVTVIGILDVSGSIRRFAQLPEIGPLEDDAETRTTIQALRAWFREATKTRGPMDRFGLIVFDGEATVVSAPSRGDYVDDNLDLVRMEGSNIADAVRLALAMLPPDTARRIVLVTDGNETAGSALEAARRAAGTTSTASVSGSRRMSGPAAGGGVPIDIVPITYNVQGDVQIARVETPPFARPGERATVRIALEATRDTPGRLSLLREGTPVPIASDGSMSRKLIVPAGQSVELAMVELGDTPVNRFEAVFEPDDPRDDVLPENNRAESFTVTPAPGAVLIVEREPDTNGALAQALTAGQLRVETRPAELLPRDLLSMQNYELVILNNIPAYELAPQQQEMLARYVSDLGGGLLMVGGEDSFGAGGWAGTPIEDVLPLDMSPPKELVLPTAAMVLVLDKSGSMRADVAGARATQQEIANEGAALAIESMRETSLIGVVTFDFVAHELVPLQRNDDPKRIAETVRSIVPDGGTDIQPALAMAYRMLRHVDVDRKHVVCLSDGQAPTAGLDELAAAMAAANIRLTTIAVGEDADRDTLQRLSEIGGGDFFFVRNPRMLPRILVDAVQVVNKPLIKEVPFEPMVHASGAALGVRAQDAPVLGGLVITAVKPSPLVTLELSHPDGEPLLAHWQAGLGRAAAFTSDAEGHWSSRWLAWPEFQAFWTQIARAIARPPGEPNAELFVTPEDGAIRMVLDTSASPDNADEYLQVDGTVYTPSGEARSVRLRQIGPGLYEGAVQTNEAGNYIVVVSPRRGERRLAPVIGGVTRPTGSEYRRYRSNLALLGELVEVTGGRRLAVEAPDEAALFDRSALPRSMSSLPAWPMLLWAALGLMLLDVACRRIAWRTAQLTALAAAIVRVPTRARTHPAQATLATLRTAGGVMRPQRPAQQRSDDGSPTRQVPMQSYTPTAKTEEPVSEPAQESGRRAPTEEEIRRAIEAMREQTTADERPADAKRQAPEPAPVADISETTSRLLQAKRRAREEDQK